MNIGFITPTKPYPPNEGGRIVAYNHLSRLAERGHDIYIFSAVGDETTSPPSELTEKTTYCQYTARDRSISAYLQGYDQPFSVASRSVPELESAINERADELDVIVVEHTHMAKYIEEIEVPSCLCVHNIEHKSLLSNSRSLFPSPKSIPFLLDAARMYLFERTLYEKPLADSFAFLSEEERVDISRQYSVDGRTWHSPVGVEMERFDDVLSPSDFDGVNNKIVFTGTMRYPPNIQAVTWFVEQILPQVRERVPDTEFFIVGKSPTEEISQLSEQPGVTVTGMVDDVSRYIANADVSVIPLREGTGIQIKLVEALAAGNPTVTTSVGARGLNVEHGRNVLIHDDPAKFGESVVEVLRNPDDSTELGQHAEELIASTYSWEVVMDEFENRLLEIQ